MPEYYSVDDAGLITFTELGTKEFGKLFCKGGVDIQSIKTENDYLLARKKCSQYFMEWMNDEASAWPINAEFNLLRTALFGTTEDTKRESVNLRRSRIQTVYLN